MSEEKDFYPAGEQAPGIQGDFKDWIPAPEAKPSFPKIIPDVIREEGEVVVPMLTEAEAIAEVVGEMVADGAIPYKAPEDDVLLARAFKKQAKE